MATDDELKYLAQHPGGFDKEFFEVHLLGLIEQWTQWTGESDYLVRMSTIHGRDFDLAYGRAALTYFVAFTESRSVEIVPMGEVTRVSISTRPTSAPKRQIGFTVEGIDEEVSSES